MKRSAAFCLSIGVAAFVAALLCFPRAGWAEPLPACEANPILDLPAPPPEPVCEVITSLDEATGETTAAPICDPSGMSAIAPDRILPVTDARIDAAPGCLEDSMSPLLGFDPDQVPAAAADAAVDLGVLPTLTIPARAAPVTLLEFDAPREAPRDGIDRSVYHPPRSA